MPNIIDGNSGSVTIVSGEDLGYTYPNGVNLTPGSPMHEFLLIKIMARVKDSSGEISKRFTTWKKIDQSLTAYIKTDDAERIVKDADERKPISIVVPYSYATLETLLTYMTAAFLDDPIFKYEGTGPEDVVGAMLLEKIVQIQCAKAKAALNLHTAFRDGFSYGLGIVAPSWTRRWGKRTVIEPDGFISSMLQKFITLGEKKVNKDVILYEGNIFKNIDPYLALPDPNVPADSPQRGEFFGWIEPSNYMALLEIEKDNPKVFFNMRYLSGMNTSAGKSVYNKTGDSGRDVRLSTGTGMSSETRPIDVIWLYVNLVPKEWKIGTGEYPEKWLFGVAADKVVVSAAPMNLNHNMFPVGVCVPDSDGYSVAPVSRLEMVFGLQTALDWMFNSHIANVRKAINDMLIVDPSLINVNDLKDPAPGKLLRMRRAAWGRGVENAVKQLNVVDVTKNHVGDSAMITDLMQKCTGSVDSLMGFQRTSSERVTADESRGTRTGALSRLAKVARLVSLQMMQDLGYMVASHTQQLMEQEHYITVSGRWEEELIKERAVQPGDKITVSPFELAIDYDVFQQDGTIAGTEDGKLWVQLFQVIGQNQLLMQEYDTGRIFLHIAKQLGAKDVSDFKRKQPLMLPQASVTTAPDGQVAQQAQAGNIIPANTFTGGM